MKQAGQDSLSKGAVDFVVNNIPIDRESCRIIAELESSGKPAGHMLASLLVGLYVFGHHSVLSPVESGRLELNITLAMEIAARMKESRHEGMTGISYICDFLTKLTRNGKKPGNLMDDIQHILTACTAAHNSPHPFSGDGDAAGADMTEKQ